MESTAPQYSIVGDLRFGKIYTSENTTVGNCYLKIRLMISKISSRLLQQNNLASGWYAIHYQILCRLDFGAVRLAGGLCSTTLALGCTETLRADAHCVAPVTGINTEQNGSGNAEGRFGSSEKHL